MTDTVYVTLADEQTLLSEISEKRATLAEAQVLLSESVPKRVTLSEVQVWLEDHRDRRVSLVELQVLVPLPLLPDAELRRAASIFYY